MFLRGTVLKIGVAAVAATTLVACGGGSDSTSNVTGSLTDTISKTENVAGPLDALQQPLSEQVVGALADAASGTPLAPVLSCVDQAVVIDLLDVVDSIALAAEQGASSGDPAAALQDAATNIQGAIEGFATNATAMLQGLAGGAGCGEGSGDGLDGLPSFGLPGGDTGTPLDDVLAQLSGLGDIGSLPGAGEGGVPGLSELAAAVEQGVAQFNNAYDMFIQQIPAEALNAPVFGGVVTLVHAAVNQLDDVTNAVASGNPADVGVEASTLLSLVLNSVLTDVLPVDALEEAIGDNPVSAALEQGAALLGEQFAAGLEQLLAALPTDSLPADELGMGGNPLDTVLGPLTGAVGGGLPSGGLPGGGGSPLDALPLDLILEPITGAIGFNDPLDALTLVNPILTAIAPFALRLPNALAGEGPFGAIGGPLGSGLTPIVEGLQPLQNLVDQLGISGALNQVLITALNEALGAVL